MTDPLPILPFRRHAAARARVPGSKSLTNRGLIFAAMCAERVELRGALFGDDTSVLCDALRALGLQVEADAGAHTIAVQGCGGRIPRASASLFTGLSGTSARFLTAFCAAAGRGSYHIDGTARMRERPMAGLFDALSSQGSMFRWLGKPGFLPVALEACGLRGGSVQVDARESSQMLSGLLMAAPLAGTPLEVSVHGGVRQPFVEMTIRQAAAFGVSFGSHDGRYLAPAASRYSRATPYSIEPDATAASYFMALPIATGGNAAVDGLAGPGESLQGDVAFSEVLRACGLEVTYNANGAESRRAGALRGTTADFNEFSDTFLTLAALAPLLDGPTRITGIAHTRKQETDRVAGAAAELRRLGQEVVETEDSIEIRPRPLTRGQTVQTYGDHRFAMSFGILGCHDLADDGTPWLSIADPGCCAKTFPGFFDELDRIRDASSSAS
ncbi:MAG TPA: 3-phosphoshikimate 1-carboxyvinyltransferase [Opitutaceae bacterium]|nr:3-phosphoshikimate 1-carboxyvinyltransferase [Opitutaceae bacterium]